MKIKQFLSALLLLSAEREHLWLTVTVKKLVVTWLCSVFNSMQVIPQLGCCWCQPHAPVSDKSLKTRRKPSKSTAFPPVPAQYTTNYLELQSLKHFGKSDSFWREIFGMFHRSQDAPEDHVKNLFIFNYTLCGYMCVCVRVFFPPAGLTVFWWEAVSYFDLTSLVSVWGQCLFARQRSS